MSTVRPLTLRDLQTSQSVLQDISQVAANRIFRSKPFLDAIRTEQKIWHPALFKSASVYLDRLIEELYGEEFCGGPPIPAAVDRMQEPDPVSVFARLELGKTYYSKHVHMRRTTYFENTLLGPNDKIIYQTRSTEDVIVSLYDHLDRQRADKGELRFFTYTTANDIWDRASQEERFEFIVFAMLPFILDMDASWKEDDQTIVVGYEEVTKDTKACLTRIAHHIGRRKSPDEIEAAISRVNAQQSAKVTNHNVGVSGRGKKMLEPDLLERIHALKARWQVRG